MKKTRDDYTYFHIDIVLVSLLFELLLLFILGTFVVTDGIVMFVVGICILVLHIFNVCMINKLSELEKQDERCND